MRHSAGRVEVIVNRHGGVPLRDQVRLQLELKILTGDLAPGARLPSVRALARRLGLHPNTIASVYKDLEHTRHVTVKAGSGIFVCDAPSSPPEGGDLDQIVREALRRAFGGGFSPGAVRAAVDRWLAVGPPHEVVVVDAARGMAELMAEEVRQALGTEVSCCTVLDLEHDPTRVSDALVLALPYHLQAVASRCAAAAVEPLTLEVREEDRRAIKALPVGAIVLFVSHAPTVLPFAHILLKALRGDDIHVETHPLAAGSEWRRLAEVADLVAADICAAETVRAVRPRRVREISLLSAATLDRLRPRVAARAPREAPG